MMEKRPDCLKVHPVQIRPDEALAHLHAGEREAILLAEQAPADIVLLDEGQAREAAQARGLRLTGLVGVLDGAATGKIVDLPQAVARLRRTNFRIAPALLKKLLERHVVGGSEF